jgi:cytochrome c oxidase subunit III
MSSASTTVKHHHAHHFKSNVHEYESSKQGIWLFLCTEILMFGGMFVGYAVFKIVYPEVFQAGSALLNWKMGAANTVVLIFSSLTMALGIHYIQKNERNKAVAAMAITIVCGAVFMVIKYFEYSHKIHAGMLPSRFYEFESGVQNLSLYFGFYFSMTGMHGLHVLVGMGLIFWVMIRTIRGDFEPQYYTAVEGVGLFWHLVDLIWIYLFPLYYLVG